MQLVTQQPLHHNNIGFWVTLMIQFWQLMEEPFHILIMKTMSSGREKPFLSHTQYVLDPVEPSIDPHDINVECQSDGGDKKCSMGDASDVLGSNGHDDNVNVASSSGHTQWVIPLIVLDWKG
ncbi:hypothetical protein ACOSQ4_004573 [Xanthoceras sorbifolium]